MICKTTQISAFVSVTFKVILQKYSNDRQVVSFCLPVKLSPTTLTEMCRENLPTCNLKIAQCISLTIEEDIVCVCVCVCVCARARRRTHGW